MDLRSLWRIVIVATLLAATPLNTAWMYQGNAVAGSVRVLVKVEDKEVYLPLEGVTVWVVQNTSISNVSRQDDGIYVLYVPSDSYKKFDLLFTKPNYCSNKRRSIENGERHKKIDVVTMIPEKEVAKLSDAQKQELFEVTKEMLDMSKVQDLTIEAKNQIETAAMRNITVLQQTIDPKFGPLTARPNPMLQKQIKELLQGVGSGE